MDLSALIIAIAVACSLPAGLVLVGVLAHRPSSAAWLRKHVRALAWFAAIGWGAIGLRNWFAPHEHSALAAVVAAVAMVGMVAFAVGAKPESAEAPPTR